MYVVSVAKTSLKKISIVFFLLKTSYVSQRGRLFPFRCPVSLACVRQAAGASSNRASACFITRSRLALCDPMDCSLPGSSVHGILQARTLEYVAIPFSSPDPGIELGCPALQADNLPSEPLEMPSSDNY